MSDPTCAVGGKFVNAGTWLETLRSLGYRAEFEPGSVVPVEGGDLGVRLGHPTIASDQDVLVQVTVEFYSLPRHVPEELVEAQRASVERLRRLDAPDMMIVQEAIKLGWIQRGAEGVIDELSAHLARLERHRAGEAGLTEIRQWLAAWQAGSEKMEQEVLFTSATHSEAGLFAEYLLAVAYARAAGGDVQYVTGHGVVTVPGEQATRPAELSDAWKDYQRTWRMIIEGDPSPPPEELFAGWQTS